MLVSPEERARWILIRHMYARYVCIRYSLSGMEPSKIVPYLTMEISFICEVLAIQIRIAGKKSAKRNAPMPLPVRQRPARCRIPCSELLPLCVQVRDAWISCRRYFVVPGQENVVPDGRPKHVHRRRRCGERGMVTVTVTSTCRGRDGSLRCPLHAMLVD